MVGLIFGIIALLAGIGLAIYLFSITSTDYVEDDRGIRLRDSAGNYIKSTQRPLKKFGWISIVVGFVLAVTLILLGCIASVPTGHTGVITTFGRVEDKTFDAGMNMKAPWHSVKKMDNRVQQAKEELSCFSSDIQEVKVMYTLNYQIDKANAQEIYKTVGMSYFDTIIVPNIAEAVKLITAQYTAEELVAARADLARNIEIVLTEYLAKYNIQVVSTAVEDMDFTDAFTNAVEAKQVAAQNKLQAEIQQQQKVMEQQAAAEMAVIQARAQAETDKINANVAAETAKIQADSAAEVAKIKAEADLQVAKTKADAEEYAGQKEAAANEAIAESITEDLLEYYYIQQWNGELPDTYVGSEDASTIILNGSSDKE